MRRRWSFVGIPVVYAVAVYLALLASRSGGDSAEILILVISVSVAFGVLAWRFAERLESARALAERGRAELALVGKLAAGLSGPLDPTEVATQYLGAIADSLSATSVATLLQYEEATETIRILAQNGPAATEAAGTTYAVAALPAGLRSKIIGEHRSYVVDDTQKDPEWPAFAAAVPLVAMAGTFSAMPLVSRSRLIGVLAIFDPRPHGIDRDQLQIVALLLQYAAGALHNALSIAEADDRADREAVANRIAQRLYSDLDPGSVVRAALEALGNELSVSRVLVAALDEKGEVRVIHTWATDGIEAIPVGTRGELPLAMLAAREGRTIAVRDALTDPRLADPSLGGHRFIARSTLAGIATPIGLGGQLKGVLVVHQTGAPRAWTVQDIRLLETIARELRTALEAANLLEARRRESERMLALHRASSLVASGTEPEAVVNEILKAAVTLLGGGGAALYRWDANAGVLRHTESAHGVPGVAAVLRPGEGTSGEAFQTQRPVIVNDYASWPNASGENQKAGITAALAVPLVRAGERIGALSVGATDGITRFDQDDARLLGLFGDQAVAALTTAELLAQQRKAVQQLERLNAAKSDFVSIVSHEFRTPLTGIQGFSELMRDEDLSVAEMKEYAGDINTDAQRLNRMITEMLDLDRMESGRMTLNLEPTDLNAILTDAAERLIQGAPRHPVRLQLEPKLPLVPLDRDKIGQVMLNLLSNAVKYSPNGGEIAITTRIEGALVHVFVRDAGLGIPADSLEKVFDRYSRLESGATRYIQGTGLGLPITRQIVEMHGGRAWVESTLGEGSMFHFTLPLSAAAGVIGGA